MATSVDSGFVMLRMRCIVCVNYSSRDARGKRTLGHDKN